MATVPEVFEEGGDGGQEDAVVTLGLGRGDLVQKLLHGEGFGYVTTLQILGKGNKEEGGGEEGEKGLIFNKEAPKTHSRPRTRPKSKTTQIRNQTDRRRDVKGRRVDSGGGLTVKKKTDH